MKRKKDLIAEYEKLEQDYKKVLAEKLMLSYEFEEIKHRHQSEMIQKDQVQKLHENARKLKHDMRNHLMVIAAYLNSNELEEAKEYTSKMLDKLNLDYSYIETGNTLINYIINNKMQKAKADKIQVKAEIDNLRFSKMDSIDFSALLGNLLDNAIEAAANSDKKVIEIMIKKQRGYDSIKIKNTIDTSVLNHNPQLISVKQDNENHGIGVKQVREIVKRYDGMLDIYEENKMFCVVVLIESE